jgi:hypothetical protein
LSVLSGKVGVVAPPQSSQLGSSTRTQAYTRCDAEINNEHSSIAKTLIRTNLEDPNKLQSKYKQHWFN